MAPSLKEYFMIDKLQKFGRTVKWVGGWKAALKMLYMWVEMEMDELIC